MKIFTATLLILLILFGVTFASLNAMPVQVNYYLDTFQLPLSLLLALTFALGAAMGLSFSVVIWLRLKTKNRQLKSQIKLSQREVENLRAIPLKDPH